MGSKSFDGVKFLAFTDDHLPVHVHGRYAGVEVIVEFIGGTARLAARERAIRPRSAKQADVNHILRTAAKYAGQLVQLWSEARG